MADIQELIRKLNEFLVKVDTARSSPVLDAASNVKNILHSLSLSFQCTDENLELPMNIFNV